MEDGCLLWGTRVIVPPQLYAKVLDTRGSPRDEQNEKLHEDLRLVAMLKLRSQTDS